MGKRILTGGVPETEFDELVIVDVEIVYVVFKYGWFTGKEGAVRDGVDGGGEGGAY